MRQAKKIKNQASKQPNTGLELKPVRALTFTQERAIRDYNNEKHIVMHGYAGTGKSYLSIGLALDSINKKDYDKLIIVRSLVPSRDIGFLPGSAEEKAAVYEIPYISICNDLYGRADAYSILKQKGIIHFSNTSYIRGITLDDCVLFVDEIQNLNEHEINSILTRVGENCRVILSGDYRQSDLIRDCERKGFIKAMDRLKKMQSVEFIEFYREDIVRSDFCREWIETEYDD